MMRAMRFSLFALFVVVAVCACAEPNQWVLKNPPKDCAEMCAVWGMEVGAIVGVGRQDREESQGATACVCRPLASSAPGAQASLGDDALKAAGYAAIPPEIRNREAEAQRRRRQQQQSSQQRR